VIPFRHLSSDDNFSIVFVKVVGLVGINIGVTLSNVSDIVSIVLGILSIGYLLWRWVREIKKQRNLTK